jgi:hypothetical protein
MSLPRLALAICASAAVILSAPFVSQIRFWIRDTFPGQFVLIVGAIVGVSLAAAIGAALVRIRDRRLPRYLAIAAAVALGTGYSLAIATADAQANAVERFHFVEYGLVTFLFYRAWRPADDGSIFVMPVLAGLLVGTLEEWLQWFVPIRVGEMRDVFLNLAAIVCGLLFSAAVDPPSRVTLQIAVQSRRRVGGFAALVVLTFASFVHSAHLGVAIHDPAAGTFTSRYDAAELARLARDREASWAQAAPVVRRLAREDQYLSEGILHVQERNRQWDAGHTAAAWRENLILENYYAPVLGTWYPAAGGAPHRWSDGQRARAAEGARLTPVDGYVSRADGGFIRTWPPLALWGLAVLLAGAALVASGVIGSRF